MKLLLKKGATSQTVEIFIQDSASTVGAGKTGLTYNTASLSAYYSRPLAAPAAITLATQTVTGAYSSGGFVEKDAANMPGFYRLDIPDAVLAAGANSASIMLKGATGMAPLPIEIQLTDFDLNTAVPDVNASKIGGTTQTAKDLGALNVTTINTLASHDPGATLVKVADLGTVQTGDTFGRIGAAGAGLTALGDTRLGNLDAAITTRLATAGYTTPPTTAAITTAVWAAATRTLTAISDSTGITTLLTRINAAITITGGKVDVNDKTGFSLATAPPTAADIKTVLEADGSKIDHLWEMTEDDAGTRRLTANALEQAPSGGAAPTPGQIADAILDEALSGHTTPGTPGAALAAASAAADPLASPVPGSYAVGTAGKLIGDNLNAPVASRSSHSAADVWAVASRTLSGVGTSVADIAAGVWSAVTRTLTGTTGTLSWPALSQADRRDYITAIGNLVGGELPLGETEKIFAISAAVKKYSSNRPRLVVEDEDGNGSFDYVLTQLAEWADGFSVVKSIEYPVDDTEATASALQDDAWQIYQKPTGKCLRFNENKPATTEDLRITYTTLHVCTDEACTIPANDETAVQMLAAANFCDMLATYYAQTQDSTIKADSVDHKSKASEYAARARTYRKEYFDHLGIVQGSVAPASVTRDQDAQTSYGGDRLTHPKRFR